MADDQRHGLGAVALAAVALLVQDDPELVDAGRDEGFRVPRVQRPDQPRLRLDREVEPAVAVAA